MTRLILGEFRRSLDDRFRLSIPAELAASLPSEGKANYILAKERPGALSLWHIDDWGDRLEKDVELIRAKIEAGHLKDRLTDVQLLGRLLSTRHRKVHLAGRSRLSIPEGFREFLGIEPGGDVLIVGAAVCIEIWRPDIWIDYLNDQIPQFSRLVDELAG